SFARVATAPSRARTPPARSRRRAGRGEVLFDKTRPAFDFRGRSEPHETNVGPAGVGHHVDQLLTLALVLRENPPEQRIPAPKHQLRPKPLVIRAPQQFLGAVAPPRAGDHTPYQHVP